MKKTYLLTIISLISGIATFGQQNLWNAATESALSLKAKTFFDGHFKPVEYKLYILDESQLKNVLKDIPDENAMNAAQSPRTISVPGADGRFHDFSIVSTSVMAPQLAAKYPSIKTYLGAGLDDPSAHIRLDYSPSGFHAMVTAAGKPTWYINPVDAENKIYLVNKRNQADKTNRFTCGDNLLFPSSKKMSITGNADDGKLRKYGLALCVNGEFSLAFLDGTETSDAEKKEKIFDVLVTCIMRANEIYERDFGIRLNYVANEDTLIFLDPATDPWPKRPPVWGASWNSKTQKTIDERIGTANYDIGHLLGKVPSFYDNNGSAGCIGCVCSDGSKGSGFTAYYNPALTDYMVIDYWAHEMGHQFGANHTFTFNYEGTQAQIEPGSGSTIMGYAGITGNTDVQPHSDDLFSVASIGQVITYIKSGDGNKCPAIKITGNSAPSAKAGSNYTIPKSTPFLLTGKGSDLNGEDKLSYIWEQTDVYNDITSNTFPSPFSTSGPVFRVYNDNTVPERSFPALPTILKGKTSSDWEALPAVDRTLSFRFTVRDNHIGGGNNKSDDMKVHISADAGPFALTKPNKFVTITGGSQQKVMWDVASSDLAPINCAEVKISLSADGGYTFPYILASSRVNDGIAKVVFPNINSTHCRVKVEAVDNIFFDISDADFTITNAAGLATTTIADASVKNQLINGTGIKIYPNPATSKTYLHFSEYLSNVEVSLADLSGKTMFINRYKSVSPGQQIEISLQRLAKGTYFIKMNSDKGVRTEKILVQ